MISSYIETFDSGILEERVEKAAAIISSCTLCPHNCRVDRTGSARGKCGGGEQPCISSCSPHFGEEACLVGTGGSGTIFFAGCSLSCLYCQNYDISHLRMGREVTFDELAEMMLSLQVKGCHNINFVTPTHMAYAILKSLQLAIPRGLRIPLIYNTGGYDSVETLELLEGLVDIYMPDFKYMDPNTAEELSGAADYPQVAMEALKEMHRQVGDLSITVRGIAEKGLLVRHLVLPNDLAATSRVLAFLADLSTDTYINVMDQYRPEYRARECFDLGRRVTLQEYDDAIDSAKKQGLYRLDRF
ncbi:MAG: radical SAM protein [bacterium]|nr:radical SAM protein [bacterium]